MREDRAKSFLQLIRRAQRGRLKIYLGYGPGVGKTYLMLQEAQRLKQVGVDIVVGIVETHGRAETAKQVVGLEVIPRKSIEYRGITVEEMDLDAVLSRQPHVVLVDELAHTNLPGSRNHKRYDDVRELLAAGIHVIATLNVQHLESLYNTVERLIGVKVRERIPDSVVAEADQVVNVDLSPEDLQGRLAEGKIYPQERVDASLENFFKQTNLEHLRELTMREIAAQIDFKRREIPDESDQGIPDQLMVCLASKGPNSARLLRFASRLAGRLNRTWYAVYVQTPKEDPTVIDVTTQRLLGETLTLANQLGATVFTFKGEDIVDTILRFAREYRVGHIVIGRPRRMPPWKRWLGRRSVAENLVFKAQGFTVVVVDAESKTDGTLPTHNRIEEGSPGFLPFAHPESPGNRIVDNLSIKRIVILNQSVTKDEVIGLLANLIVADLKPQGGPSDKPSIEGIRVALEHREAEGSTFLNDFVAIPHARMEPFKKPEMALALTRSGVAGVPAEHPIEAVFMLLAPAQGTAADLRFLTKAIQLFQNLNVRRNLHSASTPLEVFQIIADNEVP